MIIDGRKEMMSGGELRPQAPETKTNTCITSTDDCIKQTRMKVAAAVLLLCETHLSQDHRDARQHSRNHNISNHTPAHLSIKSVHVKMQPTIYEIPSQETKTTQYLIADPTSSQAAIIDPALDTTSSLLLFNPTTATADKFLALADEKDYNVTYILHTCANAAPPTAAWYLRHQLRERGQKPKVVGAKGIEGVKERVSRAKKTVEWDGVVERELEEGEVFELGEMGIEVMKLPGWSEEHVGFRVGSNVLVGELPRVSGRVVVERAGMAWLSMQRLLALPDDDKVFASSAGDRDEQTSCLTVAHYRDRLGDLATANEQDFVARQKPASVPEESTKARRSLWEKIKDLLITAKA